MTEPVLSGFHPDPSICRVGDTYYIATSSFEYSPGVPIHRSTDLIHWELIGNALDRDDQLRPSLGAKDSGIYAPTLRHHDGRFWLTTTDTSRPFDGQLIVHADSPEGPWSDPLFVPTAIGIDPDLVWDDEGTAHLSWRSFHPDLDGIATITVDLTTGQALSDPALLWAGTGLPHTEGAHRYRVGEWWYLLAAEGGTERGHVISVARSRDIGGPYESAAANPIFSHRSTDHPVQNTGHGDLVQRPDGSWAMVYLGVRPRGKTPAFHVNGRETFVAGIDWIDGWPRVDEDRFDVSVQDHSFADRFENARLHPRWIAPGASPDGFVTSGDGARLEFALSRLSRSMLLTRARDIEWDAEVDLDLGDGAGRVIVRHDDTHWYAVALTRDSAEVRLSAGPLQSSPSRVPLDGSGQVTVRIRVFRRPPPQPWGVHPEPDRIGFAVRARDGDVIDLGDYDGRYLSTEVAGGFTGRVWGVEIVSGSVRLREARYVSRLDHGR